MSRIYANPFSWGEPVSGEHYVTRKKEEDFLEAALERQAQLIITGGRGTGKTSLVQHVLQRHSKTSSYLDLTFAVCRMDIITLLLDALEETFPQAKQDGRVSALRPTIGSCELTAVLELWYDCVKRSNRTFALVWDASHYLVKMKDDIIGELREAIGNRRGISHIFISHREDVLKDIFDDPNKPFFPQRDMLYVKHIRTEEFEPHLTKRFRRMGISDFDLARSLLSFTQGHPQLTQRMAHSLAQLWLEGNTTRLIDRTIDKLLKELFTRYSTSWDGFGVNERRLLVGLIQGYSHPTELGFIKKFQLSATSTAHNTVLKLLRDGWIVARNEGYHILDPLFAKWLAYHRKRL